MSFTLTRDRWGIPHVEAGDLDGLFRGQGYACAQDRLWQLHWDRTRAQGRVSAMVGAAGVPTDRYMRRLRVADAARRGYDEVDDGTRAMLDAYARGVNDAVADGARALELERLGVTFEPWEPWHSIAGFVARHVGFGARWPTKMFRLRVARELGVGAALGVRSEGAAGDMVPSIVSGEIPVPSLSIDPSPVLDALGGVDGDGPQEPDGSNNWALAGSRTASGMPLVAGDPHRAFEVPNVYHQVYLRAPGIDVAGLAFAGVPGVPHFGHAGPVAWCVTNAGADCDDVYVERFDADGRCLGPAGPYEPDRRVERIEVRDGVDAEVESVVTRHGPVTSGATRGGEAVAMRSSGLEAPGHGLQAILPLLRARSVSDVEDAVRHWVYPANNWVSADVSGAVSYATGARVPSRGEVNLWFPVPGWTDDHEWKGIRDDLPRMRDPRDGMVVTANQRIGDDATISADFAAPWRTRRIRERLSDAERVSAADMASVHADTVTMPGLRFAVDAAAAAPDHPAVAILAGWDGRMDRDAAAPAVYAAARAEMARLRAEAYERIGASRADPPGTPPAAVRLASLGKRLPMPDDALTRALDAAWARLVDALGADPSSWRWGDLHRSRHLHALARLAPDAALVAPGVEVDGDGECVLAMTSYPPVTHEAVAGPVARYVFEVGDRPRGGWIVPLGASGDPDSPHFADQQAAWARCELIPIEP